MVTYYHQTFHRFQDNRDGTVLDTKIGLLWQKEDDGEKRDYRQALAYCQNLSLAGLAGWRLPTLNELKEIITPGRSPAIDPQIFPNAKADRYWTSTLYPGANNTVYTIDFYSGEEITYCIEYRYYVRAVRVSLGIGHESEYEKLVAELIQIGRAVEDPRRRASGFLISGATAVESRHPRAKEIGQALNLIGGYKVMLEANRRVSTVLGAVAALELTYVWDGIGDWQA
jgi:hypothetical protein